MNPFFTGFSEELLKLAQMTINQQQFDQKKDVSPAAAAGKNLGIGTAAGQPEQPAGTPARSDFFKKLKLPGQTTGTGSKQKAFKGAL